MPYELLYIRRSRAVSSATSTTTTSPGFKVCGQKRKPEEADTRVAQSLLSDRRVSACGLQQSRHKTLHDEHLKRTGMLSLYVMKKKRRTVQLQRSNKLA